MKALRTRHCVWLSQFILSLFCSPKIVSATDHIWNSRYYEDFRRGSDSSSHGKDIDFLSIGLVRQLPLVISSRRLLNETNSTNTCTLCPFGDSVGFPNKTAGYGLNGTCADVDASSREMFASESVECRGVRFVSGICGCPPLEDDNVCPFCEGGDIPTPEYVVQSLVRFGLPPMSCQDIGLFVTQYTQDALACDLMYLMGYLCGCSTANKFQKNLLIWLLRVSGTLSIIGSIYIVWDVLRQRSRSAKMSVYNELMLTMSAFDIISSTAWSIGTYAVPSENEYGEPYMSPKFGGYGTEATCTAQGFFIQLGYTCEYSLSDRIVTLEKSLECCSHISWYTSCIQPCGTT
jgi:hypothetical protein